MELIVGDIRESAIKRIKKTLDFADRFKSFKRLPRSSKYVDYMMRKRNMVEVEYVYRGKDYRTTISIDSGSKHLRH